jgi:hypothetical protein
MSLATGLDSSYAANAVTMNGQSYWGNGLDPSKSWDGIYTATNNIGYPAYASAPSCVDGAAGNVTAGVHLVRVRYKSQRYGYVGEAGAATSFTAAGSKIATVSVAASADQRIDTIVIEMTGVGGTVYYNALETPNTTGNKSVNRADSTLAEYTLDWDASGHFGPPPCYILVEHRGCLVCGGQPVYTTGTAKITATGTTVTGTTTAWKTVMQTDQWYFLPSGDTTPSRVSTCTNATTIKLAASHAAFTARGYKMWSPRQNDLYISKPVFPESFGDNLSLYRRQPVLQNRADILTGLQSYFGSLLVFGEHSFEKYEWENDYDDGRIYPVPGDRGAVSHKAVVNVEGTIYSLDRGGFWAWRGGAPQGISRPVDPALNRIAWAYASKFHAIFNPLERLVEWFLATGTQTEPATVFCWDVDQKQWSTRSYSYAITAADVCPDSEGVMRPIYFDVNGYCWNDGIGFMDGAHPTCSSVLTVDSGSTVLTCNIAAGTLFAGTYGMAGVPCYWVNGVVTFYPTSNSASKLYASATLGSAPAAGDTIEVGRIPSTYKTRAFRMGSAMENQKGLYFVLEFIPLPVSKHIHLRVYEDLKTDPKSDWTTVSTGQKGVTFTANSADIAIDVSTGEGRVKVPLGDLFNRSLEFELDIANSGIPVQLLAYYVEAQVEQEQMT